MNFTLFVESLTLDEMNNHKYWLELMIEIARWTKNNENIK